MKHLVLTRTEVTRTARIYHYKVVNTETETKAPNMYIGGGHTPDATTDENYCGQLVISEGDLSPLTYPTDAPAAPTVAVRCCVEWLRGKEAHLRVKEITWIRHAEGGMTQLIPLDSREICGYEESATYLIKEILCYGAGVKQRRFELDQRIFDWAQSLAPKFYERLFEQRQQWLAVMAEKKNVVWLKNYRTR